MILVNHYINHSLQYSLMQMQMSENEGYILQFYPKNVFIFSKTTPSTRKFIFGNEWLFTASQIHKSGDTSPFIRLACLTVDSPSIIRTFIIRETDGMFVHDAYYHLFLRLFNETPGIDTKVILSARTGRGRGNAAVNTFYYHLRLRKWRKNAGGVFYALSGFD